MIVKIEATSPFGDYDPVALPPVVVAYLDARDQHRHADAVATFAPGATVLDDGNTYLGVESIGAWIESSSSEYAYTATRIGQQILDDTHAVVHVRLDGNFPGGTVTLRCQFEHRSGVIERLAIEV